MLQPGRAKLHGIAEAAYVSTLHIRAVRALKFCSISASLVTKSLSVFHDL